MNTVKKIFGNCYGYKLAEDEIIENQRWFINELGIKRRMRTGGAYRVLNAVKKHFGGHFGGMDHCQIFQAAGGYIFITSPYNHDQIPASQLSHLTETRQIYPHHWTKTYFIHLSDEDFRVAKHRSMKFGYQPANFRFINEKFPIAKKDLEFIYLE